MAAPIRVLIADDHPMLRDGVAAVLATQPDLQLVGEATTGAEAVARHGELRPDVTLMDLQMPDMSGLEAIRAIRDVSPAARIVVLTTYDGDVRAVQAIRAGAAGYLLKSALRAELFETIRVVHAGRRRIPPEIAMAIAEHHADDALTGREVAVLARVAEGKANKSIADALAISEETVKTHMRNILSKLSANDRTHAVIIALKRGILGG